VKRLSVLIIIFLLLNLIPKSEPEIFSTDSTFGWQAQPKALGFGFPITFVKYYNSNARDITAEDSYGRGFSVKEWCDDVNKINPNNMTDCYLEKGERR